MSETTLSAEELADLKAGFDLAAAVMPEYLSAAKRVHVSKSEWLLDWWVGYGKDESCQIEGTSNHWRWLAHLLLGLASERDAPYSEDKPLDEPVSRLFATIDAQATEIARQARELELAEHNLIGRGALLLEAQTEIAALKGALEQERKKFQLETLRTSEQAILLAKIEAMLAPNHAPGAWARGCRECALVGEIRELLAKPINASALAQGV